MAENNTPRKPSAPPSPSPAPSLVNVDPKEREQIMEYFKQQVLLLKEKALLQASVREEKKLLVENAKLKKDIADLKSTLQDKQRRRTAKALYAPVPASGAAAAKTAPSGSTATTTGSSATSSSSNAPTLGSTAPREMDGLRRRGERRGRARRQDSQGVLEEEAPVNVSRLDLRIGQIVSARRHRLAECMYVQEVDLGEPAPRTVVSGLARHIPLDQLEGRLVVLLCNVRPYRLKGVVSQAMVLCGSTHDHMELLDPPTGATPGDRVTFLNYPGEPERELVPRERVWERVQKELRTDARGVATYRGVGFEVRGKGLCRAPTLTNSSIK